MLLLEAIVMTLLIVLERATSVSMTLNHLGSMPMLRVHVIIIVPVDRCDCSGLLSVVMVKSEVCTEITPLTLLIG